MKKYLFLFILLLIPIGVSAKEVEVTFSGCTDGDTAKFIMDDVEVKVRFLAIDTPETVHPTKAVESYGKNASEYTCNKITNANSIVLEFDDNSNELDKYGRYLAWIFVDGSLLQEELIEIGYAKVAYLYGDYKYTNKLEVAEEIAKKSKVGIWSDYEEENDELSLYIAIAGIFIIIIFYIFNKSSRKKINNKIRSQGKKKLKNALKNLN